MYSEEIILNSKELKILEIILKVIHKQLRQVDAARQLDCTPRSIRNYLKRYRDQGPLGLKSKLKGKPSNRAYTAEFKQTVVDLMYCKYPDFGPTLASEMLAERDNIFIGKETARQWMLEAGLWRHKRKQAPKAHPPRERRPYYGELIQIDGSPHDWFEGRSAPCCLIVFVDDATSKIQLMRFYDAETTFGYLETTRLYIERFGLPIALYSDKHSIFRVNAKEVENSTGYTQYGRAMRDLGIELIYAHSPQAKGKVENKNGTLQDRLIKEMRLDNISTMEEANRGYLDLFTERYNKKFAKQPLKPENVHLKLPITEDLTLHFTLQEHRKVSKNLTISYKGKTLALQVPGKARQLYQASVTVCESQCGNLTIIHKGKSLPFTVYNTNQHYSEPVHRKELSLRKLERRGTANIPSPEHPWRNNQALFS